MKLDTNVNNGGIMEKFTKFSTNCLQYYFGGTLYEYTVLEVPKATVFHITCVHAQFRVTLTNLLMLCHSCMLIGWL